jgi:hypothetical protein
LFCRAMDRGRSEKLFILKSKTGITEPGGTEK